MKFNKNKLILVFILCLSFFLRFHKLTQAPPSPYWEEVALGYDAYSILKTGRDHHGNFLPLISFESFGDYKPSVYFYLTIPFIKLFGLNELSVRFPSAFFGSLSVLLVYLLTKNIFIKNKNKEKISLISTLIFSISPWQLQLSRVAFESNLALFLFLLAFYLFIYSINNIKNKKSLLIIFLSSLFFGLTIYTYHSYKILTPIFGIFLGLFHFKILKQNKKIIIIGILTFIIIFLPTIINLKNPEISHRFSETSAFSDINIIKKSNQKILENNNSFISRLVYHRYRYYGQIFLKNYSSHFSPNFLFLNGDSNLRHSNSHTGQIYFISLPFLVLGAYLFFKNKTKELTPILALLLISPIPSAITKAIPHALRSLPLIVPLCVMSAYGFFITLKLNKHKRLFLYLVSFALLLELLNFSQYYFYSYPQETAKNWWQYGYKEMVDFVNQNKDQYDQILITRENGRPAMYYWFYSQTDPKLVQKWNNIASKDQGEFLQFENIYFGIKPEENGKQLIVSMKRENLSLLKEIKDPTGETVFYIYSN